MLEPQPGIVDLGGLLEQARSGGLTVELTEDLSAVLHPIASVKHGEKTQTWQIDAITGATVSSVAVAKILRESTAFWAPKLRPRLDDFRQGENR